MKKSLLPVSAIAICAAVLAGCEWGGVHSGESWNDAYSWANFTGTYKLVNSLDTATTSSSSSSTGTVTTVTQTKRGSCPFSVDENATAAKISTGQINITAGSVTVSCSAGSVKHTWQDNGTGTLVYNGTGDGYNGTISYTTGAVTLNFGSTHSKYSGVVEYSYTGTKTSGGSSDDSGSGSGKKGPPITWLNLNQKGNLLSFQDSNGTTYSGKITGASVPKEDEGGYMMSGHIRFTFEATCNQNTRITLSGSISGDYSGSTSKTGGVLANRTIDAIYHSGSGGTSFQAVSGSTVVNPREVSAYSGVTE